MSSSSLLEKSVAVKLGVARDDGVGAIVYRRVDLSRHGSFIYDGPKLFRTLKLYAIQSVLEAEELPSESLLDQYKVRLYYTDYDNDTIFIGSHLELYDAFKYHESRKVAKILAKVVPIEAAVAPTTPTSSSISVDTPSVTETATQTPIVVVQEESAERAIPLAVADGSARLNQTSNHEFMPPHHHPIQIIAEAIAGLVGSAVASARIAAAAAAAETSAQSQALRASTSFAPAATTSSAPLSTEDTDTAAATVPEATAPEATKTTISTDTSTETTTTTFIHYRHTCDGCAITPIVGIRYHAKDLPDFDLCTKCYAKYEGELTFDPITTYDNGAATTAATATEAGVESTTPSCTSSTTAQTAPETEPEEPLPFIHGRHTCDSCLTTPIVGQRYHSLDLPDYDLCAACFNNYQGELRFEAVELDRDRPFQERWHRRRARWGPGGRGGGCRRHGGGGPRHRCGSGGRGGGHHHFHHYRGHGGPHGCPPGMGFAQRHPAAAMYIEQQQHVPPTPAEVDGALKEAIRRSLQDLKDKKRAERQAEAEKAEAALKETANVKEEPKDEELAASSEGAATEASKIKEEPNDEPKTFPETPVRVKKEEPKTAEPLVEEPEDAKQSAASMGTPRSRYNVSEDSDDEEEVYYDSAKFAEANKTPSKESAASPTKVDVSTPGGIVDISFASDAEGNGDVAAALGEMMDQVASAISEMNVELDRMKSTNTKQVKEEPEIVVPASTDPDALGAKIVDGEEANAKDELSSHSSSSSWDEVDDEFVASEEALARAAMVIGSSLLSSDMAQSEDNHNSTARSGTIISSMGSVSSVGSVPTTVPSIATERHVSAPQLERWAVQLQQLHELGFHDDTVLVDTIERLSAANIGVDSNDEVSVQQVVNELMKEY